MNLYLRYFDQEAFATNVDQAIDFLKSIPEIGMDESLEADVRDYAASDVCYPKRYKVRPRVYFIVIKTTAARMVAIITPVVGCCKTTSPKASVMVEISNF